jgi:hypothetical protein
MNFPALVAFSFGLSLAVAPVSAATVLAGSVDMGYAGTNADGSNVHGLEGGASALIGFGRPGFGVQVDGAGGHVDVDDGSANQWSGALHGFWRDAKGAVGLSSGYGSLNVLSIDANAFEYGAFGDWFVRDDLSLRFRGGGLRFKLHDEKAASGWYGGTGAAYYVVPDLSLAAEADYIKLDAVKFATGNFGIEYLISRSYPISAGISYSYDSADFGGDGINGHGFMVRLKYRFGASGSLVDCDRTGPLSWTGLAL